MTTAQLFTLNGADVALTTDDWYTPRWIFKAAALTFDIDVAAPVDPAMRTCPAATFLTPVEDGLTSPWHGVVWMNPPYSRAAPWIDRFAQHPHGLALLLGVPRKWLGPLLRSADAITLLTLMQFGRPDGSVADLKWPCILVARGETAVAALARVAAADKYVQGAYHVKQAAS